MLAEPWAAWELRVVRSHVVEASQWEVWEAVRHIWVEEVRHMWVEEVRHMRVEVVTAVEVVRVLSWQVAGTVALCLGWVPVLVPVPLSKQTQDVALDQGHQTRAVAWVGLKQHAEVWGVPASKEPGTWSAPQIGPMSVKAEETSTRLDITMWVREPVASRKKP